MARRGEADSGNGLEGKAHLNDRGRDHVWVSGQVQSIGHPKGMTQVAKGMACGTEECG